MGPRGSLVTMGSRGIFFNAGIPGMGLSSRSCLGPSPGSKWAVSAQSASTVSIAVGIRDDGRAVDGHYLEQNDGADKSGPHRLRVYS